MLLSNEQLQSKIVSKSMRIISSPGLPDEDWSVLCELFWSRQMIAKANEIVKHYQTKESTADGIGQNIIDYLEELKNGPSFGELN